MPPALSALYGDAILPHVEAAWSTRDSMQRIIACDRAVLDPLVVAAHHANRTVIAGRYRTVFASAFQVRLPVPPAAILRVWQPTHQPVQPMPDMHLQDLLNL